MELLTALLAALGTNPGNACLTAALFALLFVASGLLPQGVD